MTAQSQVLEPEKGQDSIFLEQEWEKVIAIADG